MTLSLREAADEAAVSKSTILRAIRAGRLSAGRTDDGGYAIDPAELFRVYPPHNGARDSTHHDGTAMHLQQLVDILREQLVETRADLDRWRSMAESVARQLADGRGNGRTC